jgi:alcohol dehydrogenase class IV
LQHIDIHVALAEPDSGIEALRIWSKTMGIRGLGAMGLNLSACPQIATEAAEASSMKGNPFALSQAELVQILQASLS